MIGTTEGKRSMGAIKWGMALVLAALPASAEIAGYAGQETRAIKALSGQEVADLLAGRGMGLAKAAELNHYPGPIHVLELRAPLALTVEQERAVEAIFARMQDAARPLGARLVEREAALDRLFAEGRITPERLQDETATIAELQGRLRTVHLAAHLATRVALTPEQVVRYDALRGYGGRPQPGTGHEHHRG
jgi:hypothetical protein